jgi:ubiquinone/menaquinone biosynthesis C-methylase UbiE
MVDDIFWEIHKDLPREGPGDDASTRRAYEMITDLPANPRILDVACGPGMQTLALCRITGITSSTSSDRITGGTITAVDNHQPFLDELERRLEAAGVADRVTTVNASMFDMPFDSGSFDLIWCEGAMYTMGVTEALTNWRRFLASPGWVVFTEPCFLTDEVPDHVREYWHNDYAGMTSVPETARRVEAAGYSVIGNFTIPDAAWWTDYYTPQLARLKTLSEKYRDQARALAQVREAELEIHMHEQYSKYYGYVFFVARCA